MIRALQSLSHCATALLVQIPVTLLLGPWAGLVAVVAWFWSREKVQHENRLRGGASTFTVWMCGWLPNEWPVESRWDLACPAFTSSLVALAVSYL